MNRLIEDEGEEADDGVESLADSEAAVTELEKAQHDGESLADSEAEATSLLESPAAEDSRS